MATVYRAEDTALRRDVAVKILHAHLLRDPAVKTRFVREARAAAGLDHPAVLKVFDVDESDDGTSYIVMELLRGRTLKAFLDESGAPLAEVVAMAGAALGDALAVAHAAGIIHRDVKPANVMVTTGGRVVLCDFGVARVIDDDALATQSGMLLGTPAYMSPEQALGRRVDERSDVYGLGATLYHMATGAAPFSGTTAAVIQDVVRGRLVAPLRRNPTIGGELAQVIEHAMARDPEARLASARALKHALEEIAAAAGFTDGRTELAAYFQDPGGWNQRATPRILARTVERARAAATQRRTAKALSLAERVLAIDPANSDANSLVARLGIASHRRRQAMALLAAAGALAVVSVTALVIFNTSPAAATPDAAPPAPAPAPTPAPDPVPDAPPAPAPAPAPPPPPDAAPVARSRPRRPETPSPPVPVPVPVPVPDPAPAPLPDARPAPAPASVTINIRPWCDITIDGRPHDRSPRRSPIPLDPGRHTLRCVQPGLGHAFERDLDLAPGETLTINELLVPAVRVRVDVRDAAVFIDGTLRPPGARLELSPGTHRVELRRGATVIAAEYIQISTKPCTIRDTPELACYED